MSEIKLRECPDCKGKGTYTDHHSQCHEPCSCGGVDYECELCSGKGKVYCYSECHSQKELGEKEEDKIDDIIYEILKQDKHRPNNASLAVCIRKAICEHFSKPEKKELECKHQWSIPIGINEPIMKPCSKCGMRWDDYKKELIKQSNPTVLPSEDSLIELMLNASHGCIHESDATHASKAILSHLEELNK